VRVKVLLGAWCGLIAAFLGNLAFTATESDWLFKPLELGALSIGCALFGAALGGFAARQP
jgi:hypothetical protein